MALFVDFKGKSISNNSYNNALSLLEDLKRTRAAVMLQALWRGYSVRRDSSLPTAVHTIRSNEHICHISSLLNRLDLLDDGKKVLCHSLKSPSYISPFSLFPTNPRSTTIPVFPSMTVTTAEEVTNQSIKLLV